MTAPNYGNRVKMTVTGTPGTGNIALSTACSGYQTFANGFPTRPLTVSYVAEDGTAWELGTATLDSNGGNLTSRVLTESSTGNLLSLTSNTIVFCDLSANQLNALCNNVTEVIYNISPCTPTFTGTLRWYPSQNCTLWDANIAVGVKPSTSAVTCRVNKNGSAIMSSITVGTGNNTGTAVANQVSMVTTDYLTVDLTSADTTADYLTLRIRYTQ